MTTPTNTEHRTTDGNGSQPIREAGGDATARCCFPSDVIDALFSLCQARTHITRVTEELHRGTLPAKSREIVLNYARSVHGKVMDLILKLGYGINPTPEAKELAFTRDIARQAEHLTREYLVHRNHDVTPAMIRLNDLLATYRTVYPEPDKPEAPIRYAETINRQSAIENQK